MLELRGEYGFATGRETLWRLLNDPEALRQAIPGCNAVERLDADRYRMGLRLQVAGVSGEYMGEVEIRERREPSHYVLAVSGEGSIGFMMGEAAFDLDDEGPGRTRLRYSATAQVGGVVAGVGQRVLLGVARFLIGRFFKALEQQVARVP